MNSITGHQLHRCPECNPDEYAFCLRCKEPYYDLYHGIPIKDHTRNRNNTWREGLCGDCTEFLENKLATLELVDDVQEIFR